MATRSGESTRVILCLFSILFVGVADNQVLSPLLPAIRLQFAKSAQETGLIFTGYSISAGVMVLLWGPLSDRFGRKRGLLAGLLGFSIGSAISLTSLSFAQLMYGRIVTGAASGLLSLNVIAYAADYFSYARRGWAMGSILSSYFAALILGVPIGSYIGDAFGWWRVFWVPCASSLLLFAATLFFLPAQPLSARGTLGRLSLLSQVRTYTGFMRDTAPAGALASSFLASAGMTGFIGYIGIWLHDAYGIPARKIGLVFLISGGAALMVSPLAGALSDRIGKRIQFIVSNVLLALLLLVLPRVEWGLPMFAVLCFISLAAALRQGPMEALITEVVPAVLRGSFVALKNSFSQLGIALAAAVAGMLFQGVGYEAVCWFCAILNLGASLCMLIWVRHE